MEDREILLVHEAEENISFVSENEDSHLRSLPLLSGSCWMKRELDGHELRIFQLPLKERAEGQPPPLTAAARAFLAQHVAPAVLEVFPEWRGILIESPLLEEAVWIVRDYQNGRRLAQEMGQPFILLDEILAQEGQS